MAQKTEASSNARLYDYSGRDFLNTSQTNRPKRTLAAICWFALLISLKFGGPFGFLKLAFCEYPFAHITSIGYYPEPGATERELEGYQQDVRLSDGQVEIAL